MKLLQTTYEYRAYSEEEAKNFIESFRQEAKEKGYTVKSAGWTHKEKTKSKVVVAEAWVVKCSKTARWSKSSKSVPVRTAVCNSTARSRNCQ